MKVTATNGNRRNLIEGQRVTIRTRSGREFSKTLPAGNAIKRQKYRDELIDFIRVGATLDALERFGQVRPQGAKLIDLFARNKARRVVVHGKRGAV